MHQFILVSFCNLQSLTTGPLLCLQVAENNKDIISYAPVSLGYPDLTISATGLARSKGRIYCLFVSRRNNFYVAVLRENDLAPLYHQELPEIKDGHSVLVIDDSLYVVSTGTDEVICYDIKENGFDHSRVVWKASDAKADTHHINSIVEKDGEILVSAFGPKAGQLWATASNGYVYNITTNEPVIDGIYHPHSLSVRNGDIYYSDSQRNSFCAANQRNSIFDLNGYTRGVSWLSNDVVCLATSIGRRVSKSTRFIANPDDPGELAGECGLTLGDISKKGVIKTIDLSWFGPEIYDLLVLRDSPIDLLALSNLSQKSERDAIQVFTREYDGQITGFNQVLAERDVQIGSLNQDVVERDGQVAGLSQVVAERDGQIAGLNQTISERDGQVAGLNQVVAERDGQIASLNQAAVERDKAIVDRDGQIAHLSQVVAERDGQIAGLSQVVADRDSQIANVNNDLVRMMSSNSWRMTEPLRALRRVALRFGMSICRYSSEMAHYVWRRIPLSIKNKVKIKDAVLKATNFRSNNQISTQNLSEKNMSPVSEGQRNKIAAVTMVYNEAFMLPYFLHHYQYLDEIHVLYETDTTDESLEILKRARNVVIKECHIEGGLDDIEKINLVNKTLHSIKADWVYVLDPDEFIFPSNESPYDFLKRQNYDVVRSTMYQVYRHRTDQDLNPLLPPIPQRIHGNPDVVSNDQETNRAFNSLYIKPNVVRPSSKVRFFPGAHAVEGDPQISPEAYVGAHWHMADPSIAVRRRMERKARISERNKAHQMGWQNYDVTEDKIMAECERHLEDPIIDALCSFSEEKVQESLTDTLENFVTPVVKKDF
ncbi:MAG: DUF4915 domain-containing protein [Smithellaceae bacterium]